MNHPLPIGTQIVSIGGAAQGDWDEDEDDNGETVERRARPGETGKITSADWYEKQGWTYGVVFDECNAWIFLEQAEIEDAARYTVNA